MRKSELQQIKKNKKKIETPRQCRTNSIWYFGQVKGAEFLHGFAVKSRGYLENNRLSHLSTTNCLVFGVQRWGLRVLNVALRLKFPNDN